MKKTLSFLLVLISSTCMSQISFEYDSAGNQILRKWCITCRQTNEEKNTKEISQISPDDLLKFFPEDIISYYPNPVKEQLYLKWELINDRNVNAIHIYSITGKILRSVNNFEDQNSTTLSFSDFPTGVFLVNLTYSDGIQKSIRIIKE